MLINNYLSTSSIKYFFNVSIFNFFLNQIFFKLKKFNPFKTKNLNKLLDNTYFEDLKRLSFILN